MSSSCFHLFPHPLVSYVCILVLSLPLLVIALYSHNTVFSSVFLAVPEFLVRFLVF